MAGLSGQCCSDGLHMPHNLDFISLPLLISASVIQINSNEISRGTALFGWGVCTQWGFPEKAIPLFTVVFFFFFLLPFPTCGRAVSHKNTLQKNKPLCWLLWIPDFATICSLSGTQPNQKREIRLRQTVEQQGFDLILSVDVWIKEREAGLCERWRQDSYMIDLSDDLNKQRLFVCAHCGAHRRNGSDLAGTGGTG